MPPGFCRLIAAQFVSALADNALLLVAMAFLHQQGHPAWWAPLLKFCFTMAYVVLSPGVGPLADAVPKARVMSWMNGIKALGVVLLCVGLHPLLAFAIVGLGAAGYAPAKYGLLTEIVGADDLVRANAWIEVSVVAAVLLGTAGGGLLVSQWLADWPPHASLAAALRSRHWADGSALGLAFGLLLALYGLAAGLNIGLPDSGRRYARQSIRPLALLGQFRQANASLWRDPDGGRLAIGVTTVFWGVGAVLQFAVLRQATEVLGLSLAEGAALQAVVALGVVAGAGLAGRHVNLSRAPSMLPWGILFGLLVVAGAFTQGLYGCALLMILAGAAGGLLVVPMNALLQHRGYRLLTAGRSIAVQGFNENAGVLLALGVYAALVRMDVPPRALLVGLGVLLSVLMSLLWWRQTAPRSRRVSVSR